MALSRKPAPLWILLVAAACFAIAAVLQEAALTRVLFLVAAAAIALAALLQWRMRRKQ